jgi:hypothetical protein
MTDMRVNNVMRQLINNDLYIENKIISKLDYFTGPKAISSQA